MKSSFLVAMSVASLIGISSCGKPEEKKEKPSSGPQTGPGRILEAAKNAKDKANEQTRRLEDGVPANERE